MEINIKANSEMTRELDMVSTHGPMEKSMKGGGMIVNSMVLESHLMNPNQIRLSMVCGSTASAYFGTTLR